MRSSPCHLLPGQNSLLQPAVNAATRQGTDLWPIEDVLNAQHGDDCQDFFAASQMDRHDEHLGRLGLQWKLGHLYRATGGVHLAATRHDSYCSQMVCCIIETGTV